MNSERYTPFITKLYWEHCYNYMYRHGYNSEFGDVVPSMVCNALGIRLVIVEEQRIFGQVSRVLISPESDHDNL